MQRVALLNWKNKNQDYDLSKILQSLASSWVASGLQVTTNQVGLWYAFIQVTRDAETFYVLFENTTNVVIDTTWTKKVWIAIDQTKVDDGSNNAVDWSWIGTIATWTSYPASNYIPLASITSWVITDTRTILTPKVAIDIQKQSFTYCVSTWSANAYVLTLPVAITWYTNWQKFSFKSNFLNTWSSTVNIYKDDWNLAWVLTLKKLWWTTNLGAWDIQNNQVVEFVVNWAIADIVSPIWQSPSVSIHSLSQLKFLTELDENIIYDESVLSNVRVDQNWFVLYYWDWTDWSATISTTVTLTRDMNYSSLTVTWTWILKTAWYKIFCTWTLTNQAWWQIICDEVAWWNASWWVAWVPTALTTTWTTNISKLWTAWATWVWAVSAWWPASYIDVNDFYSVSDILSVNAWNGWVAYSAGWSWVNPLFQKKWPMVPFSFSKMKSFSALWFDPITKYKFWASNWWGSWARYCWVVSWAGWCGWNNAGWLFIFALAIVNAWTISANWWPWWTWWTPGASSNNGWINWGWGGGWGWVGWFIILFTPSLTNTWTIRANWWVWWTWWGWAAYSWYSWAYAWNWWDGWTWWIIIIPVWYAGTVTVTWGALWTWWPVNWTWTNAWVNWIAWVTWKIYTY